MRKLSIIIASSMVVACYAYKINNTAYYINETETAITQESLKLQEMIDLRLPAKSNATTGTVTRHKINSVGFSYSLFIIGDDPVSHQWLAEHLKLLKKIQAIGFVTNIESNEAYEALQKKAGVPLLPANVDDLLTVLNASHYPLISHQGEVWQ